MACRSWVGVAALWMVAGLAGQGQQQPAKTPANFGGTYEALNPAQKQLIDEWYADYNKLTGDHADPKEYNQYSLSTRTTYEAVTHALQTTAMTDKSGKPIGTALDLVEAIEAINGKVTRARGDLQFRMYVVLKPDARQKLKDSSEFFRDRDNTVYHHGYPLNYRQDGTPSIQFSMTKDGRHADIDVDYRSSGFPSGLFNGHLTAANSDVRAGNNTQIHLQRWQGLADWWRSLFGMADVADDTGADLLPGDVPAVPRKGEGKLDDAVQDFLVAWLVEGKPEVSAAYFSPRSFTCLAEYGPHSGRVVNAGNAPYVAARDLGNVSKAIGKVDYSGGRGATRHTAGTRREGDEAALHDNVRALRGDERSCRRLCLRPRARPTTNWNRRGWSKTKDKPGNYFVSVFRLKGPKSKSDAITLLWTKERQVLEGGLVAGGASARKSGSDS